jgi:methionine sulfoxide reductase catalytic subunit
MLIRTSRNNRNFGLRESDVTPRQAYMNRRQLLGAVGGASLLGLGLADRAEAAPLTGFAKPAAYQTEKASPKQSVTTYNNYYEFGTGKDEPSMNAPKWKPKNPWTIRIEGEVKAPKTIDVAAVEKLGMEERIYRMRCVERWSFIIPWIGVPLATVLKQVEPTANAKYVAFETYYNSAEMLSAREAGIALPYVEGLRLDEAMHPLTLLAVGMYGETMPNQNGAPIRLVVPWKYGYKGIKSITRIRFTATQPPTTWGTYNAREYGFFSNVNPARPHPRWPQDQERRLGGGFLGQGSLIPTQPFNGYANEVAGLYKGQDIINKDF